MEKTKTTKFLGSFSLSKNGGGAGGTPNYNDLTNKPKVNGIVLSGTKTSADLGITTLTPFPSTWPTTGKFEDLLTAIRADTIAVKGASFLGEVTFDDLPANLGNAEIKIEILEGTTSATKVIHSVITSGNRKPYRWEYTSWNSGNSNSGWISFQLPLTAGTNITIVDNVISATGGSSTTISTVLNNQSTDATASSSKAVWDKVKVLEDNPVSGNDDFLITGTGVLATDSRYSREFTKTKEGIAYGMVYANTSGYDGPILVSEDKDIVIYTPGGQLGGSFELYGKTWYYSAAEFFVEHVTSFTLGLIKVNTASERTFDTLEAAKYVIENGYSYIEKGLTTKVNSMEPTVQEAYTKTNLVAGNNITIDEVLPSGKVAINNALTKTSQLTNDSGFLTSVPENLVTTDTEQEITGAKSFENPITFSNNNGALNFRWRGSGLRVSGSDSNIYVGNTGYPLVLESSEPVKMNGKQLATLDDVSVNGKTRAITLTGADIQTTYTANPEVAETTTSDINTALTAICEDIHNVLTNVPTGAEIMSTTVYPYQAPLATDATLADVITKVNTILAIMSERGIMNKSS